MDQPYKQIAQDDWYTIEEGSDQVELKKQIDDWYTIQDDEVELGVFEDLTPEWGGGFTEPTFGLTAEEEMFFADVFPIPL